MMTEEIAAKMRSSVLAWLEESLTEAQRRVKAAPHFASDMMVLTALLFPGVHPPRQLIRIAFCLLVLYGFEDPLAEGYAEIFRGFGKWVIGQSCRTRKDSLPIHTLVCCHQQDGVKLQGDPQLECTGGSGDEREDLRSRSVFVHQFDCGGSSTWEHLFKLDQPTIWQQCQQHCHYMSKRMATWAQVHIK
jgi:hypothetical protein